MRESNRKRKANSINCSRHTPKGKCKFPGCKNQRCSNGKCPKCGKHRVKNLCWRGLKHHKSNLLQGKE